jgi:hypothetical protein
MPDPCVYCGNRATIPDRGRAVCRRARCRALHASWVRIAAQQRTIAERTIRVGRHAVLCLQPKG